VSDEEDVKVRSSPEKPSKRRRNRSRSAEKEEEPELEEGEVSPDEEDEEDEEDEDIQEGLAKPTKTKKKSGARGCAEKDPDEKSANAAWGDTKLDCVSRSSIAFRQYQLDVKNMLLRKDVDRFTAAHPMGSGKTLTAVLTAECLMEAAWRQGKQRKRAIVVAPATLLTNFYNAIIQYGRTAKHIEIFWCFFSPEQAAISYVDFLKVCEGNIMVIDEVHELRTTITEMTPKALAAKQNKLAKDDAKKIEAARKKGEAALKKEIERYEKRKAMREHKLKIAKLPWLGWSLGVDKGGKAAVVLLGAQKAWKVLTLSGTLVVNAATDLQNIMILNDHGPTHTSKWSQPVINTRYLTKFGKEINEGKFDKRMAHELKCHVSYLEPEDVKADMPSYSEIAVLFEMDPDYYKRYLQIEEAAELAAADPNDVETFKEAGPFQTFLRQISNKLADLPNPKTQFILELLKEFRGGPMIVSTAFKNRGVKPIATALEKAGYNVVVISGDQNEKARLKAQKDYNAGKANVIILTAAGSRGWNLIGTKVHVNLEPAWHDAGRRQAMFRGIRVASHSHLPLAERHVAVYSLLLVKPTQYQAQLEIVGKAADTKKPGAPQYVMARPCSVAASSSAAAAAASSSAAAASGSRSKSRCISPEGVEEENSSPTLPSIDFLLWQAQMKKAAITTRIYENVVGPASIEKHGKGCEPGIRGKSPSRSPVASSSAAAASSSAAASASSTSPKARKRRASRPSSGSEEEGMMARLASSAVAVPRRKGTQGPSPPLPPRHPPAAAAASALPLPAAAYRAASPPRLANRPVKRGVKSRLLARLKNK
jgi:hypothetical protein